MFHNQLAESSQSLEIVPMHQVKIYTDGACKKNPGPGGYAAILVHKDARKEISGGYRRTTNNRMEMMAAIEALTALKAPCEVALFSDSKYLVDAMSKKWYVKWRNNGWLTSTGDPVKNIDLWQRLIQLTEHHRTIFLWVRGHAGHVENERCDALAVAACKGGNNLSPDTGFETDSC
jgi:ribonuclease HI